MRPASAQDIDGMIRLAAERVALPPEWIRAVMQVESGRDAHAISAQGAMGLMQIMPATWQGLQRDLGLGADPFDPQDNILAGASYLRLLHDRYGDAGFLAAYNAGPGRYEAHLATGQPLPHETREYVASVAHLLDQRTFSADSLHESGVSVAREQPEEMLFVGHFPRMPQALAGTSGVSFVPVSMEPKP
ncbi:lytic transglycosylase domain-containing protein [Komagataeibacter oboediens]|uniref:lytic transglycosylase domain-containing protein n=1 Tax=Komagataeibacter oboediens TaxID=65958 RepID=UPI00200D0992|nr:lytic transglycosylase domain-containing protein [Komagataeibacter oboediens]MCK9821527.1 lytic transglycosylase domain-containing protein [Komagataeibacter oboediens]